MITFVCKDRQLSSLKKVLVIKDSCDTEVVMMQLSLNLHPLASF